ncbi:hypothetical protein [Rhodococcus pyridinivorans]|uniref:hypothetical protein n=1 Tax=Rhodococcus pyridinivorans TaxID=103816 RepID=UPI0020788D61|nr:hypothetical protein [Rhodococcus pyridinivorans]USI88457.1 hypothetical protein LLA01_12485 [Rhodococcus pyridinivorans]
MDDAGARFTRRRSELGPDATPREAIRAVLTELLPLDEQRREETLVLGAFGWSAITGGGITAEDTFAAPRPGDHRRRPTPADTHRRGRR